MLFNTALLVLFPVLAFSAAIPRQLTSLDPTSIPLIMVSNDTYHTEHAVLVPVDNNWHCISSFVCYDYTPQSAHPYDLPFPFQGPDSPCAAENVTAVVNIGNANCTVHAPVSNQTYVAMPVNRTTANYTIPVPIARACCGKCDTSSKDATELLSNGTTLACT